MFAVVGLVGTAILVLSLVLDDVFDAALPDGGWISAPVIGAFLAAFGLFGWVAVEGFDAPVPLAAVAGIAGGVALGWFTFWLSRTLLHGPTDPTPTTASLVGHEARVVTPVQSGGTGEVLVRLAGQPVKLTATADHDLAVGASAVVIEVQSSTKVVVQAAEQFWGG